MEGINSESFILDDDDLLFEVWLSLVVELTVEVGGC